MAEQLSLPLGPADPRSMVNEFITVFSASTDPEVWETLINEELDEFDEIHAEVSETEDPAPELLAELLKEAVDVSYVTLGFAITSKDGELHQLPFMTKLRIKSVMLAVQTRFSIEVFGEALTRVHASNMSKLGPDGTPLRREDGKILKGPNYAPPQLIDILKVDE